MLYGLIGEHLGHSFSRDIHGRLSSDPYELCELRPDELGDFLRRRDFRGINVTIPYKQAVMPYLDELDESARGAGAVNTIVNRDGKLRGYNTDYDGFIALARHAGVDFGGARVVILGAGGAAKAVRAAALAMGAAELVNAVRTVRGDGQLPIDDPATYDGCNVLVNATPVGMYPKWQEAPIELQALLPRMQLRGVLDCIYNPLRTPLVLDARSLAGSPALGDAAVDLASLVPPTLSRGPLPFTWPRAATVPAASPSAGLPAECGLMMLVAQAVKAREYFTGESIPDEVIEKEYRHLLNTKQNIVLCGMPSSGKSTVAKALAERTGRRVVDTDEIVALQADMEIPEIFAREGEQGFRARETVAIESIASEQGLIIATGGGAVLKPENVRMLRSNGLVCLLERDLALLTPGGGRPLAPDRSALRALWHRRLPAYLAAADVRIDNNGTLDHTISQLLSYVD